MTAPSANYPEHVLVRMPTPLHEAVKARAVADDRSVAQTIRHAIRLYLEAEESDIRQ